MTNLLNVESHTFSGMINTAVWKLKIKTAAPQLLVLRLANLPADNSMSWMQFYINNIQPHCSPPLDTNISLHQIQNLGTSLATIMQRSSDSTHHPDLCILQLLGCGPLAASLLHVLSVQVSGLLWPPSGEVSFQWWRVQEKPRPSPYADQWPTS